MYNLYNVYGFSRLKLVKLASLDTLRKDLATIPAFYNDYLQYTKENPKEQTEREKNEKRYQVWYSFSALYQVFYAYAIPADFDGNPNNIHYGRIECTMIREFGNGDKITLSLLYDCGVGNGKNDGDKIIGHLGIPGDINKFIENIKNNGYKGDEYIFLVNNKELSFNLQDIENYALTQLPIIINRKYPY